MARTKKRKYALGETGRISFENYKELINKIGIGKLPQNLKDGHTFLSKNYDSYYTNDALRESIEDYLRDLNKYVDGFPKSKQKEIFEVDNGYSGHKFTGSKYKHTKNLKTSEIAKLVKQELDIKFGDVAKFSVTSEVFSGGSSINVSIYDLTFIPYTDEFLQALKAGKSISDFDKENRDQYSRFKERFNDEYIALEKRAEAILHQYNFDDSDSQVDYFHVNFYGHVRFDENKYLAKHFPDSPDAKRHKEFSESWDASRKKAKEHADKNKGKFKKGEIVWYKAELHSSWHKYKLPNGLYLAKIYKSPNGRSMYSHSYDIAILKDIKTFDERTLKYNKDNGYDKDYIVNEYGTFGVSSSRTAWEKELFHLNDPSAKFSAETEPVKESAPPEKETKPKSTKEKKPKTKQEAEKKAARKEKKKKLFAPAPAFEPVTLDNYFHRTFNTENWPEKLKLLHEWVIGETDGVKNIETVIEDLDIRNAVMQYLDVLNDYLQKEAGLKPLTFHAIPVRQISQAIKFIKRYAALDGKTLSLHELSTFIKALQRAMVTQQIRATDPHQQIIYHIQDALVDTYNNAIEGATGIEFTIKDVEQYRELAKSEAEMLSVKLLKRYVGLIGKYEKEKQEKLYKEIIGALADGRVPDTDPLKVQLEIAAKSLYAAFTEGIRLQVDDVELSGLNGLGFIPAMIAAAVGKGIEHFTHRALTSAEPATPVGCPCEDFTPLSSAVPAPDTINPGRAPKEPEPPHVIEQPEPQHQERPHQEPEIEQPAEAASSDDVMSVNEARALTFDLIGLDGKYLELIGEACRPTSFFIYGPGGSGKSTFTLLFSNYMAHKFNRVLYVAGEQFKTPVFTKMLDRLNIQDSPNFRITKTFGTHDLSQYEIVAVDSKDSLNYSLEDFKDHRDRNPHLTFVILSQATKDGGFTGSEKWRNEVDTLIYCEKLHAFTNRDKNRWGGSAEIDIYSLIEK